MSTLKDFLGSLFACFKCRIIYHKDMDIYRTQGNVNNADCLVVHAFGSSTDVKSVNHQLAMFAFEVAKGRPIITDLAVAEAAPQDNVRIAHVMKGEAATHLKVQGKIPHVSVCGDGTWGSLVRAQQYMLEHDLSRPMMVAQAWHVSRVAKQASKLGLQSIVPEGLPRDFDKNSNQFWTRSAALWLPFNALGSLLLRWRGRL